MYRHKRENHSVPKQTQIVNNRISNQTEWETEKSILIKFTEEWGESEGGIISAEGSCVNILEPICSSSVKNVVCLSKEVNLSNPWRVQSKSYKYKEAHLHIQGEPFTFANWNIWNTLKYVFDEAYEAMQTLKLWPKNCCLWTVNINWAEDKLMESVRKAFAIFLNGLCRTWLWPMVNCQWPIFCPFLDGGIPHYLAGSRTAWELRSLYSASASKPLFLWLQPIVRIQRRHIDADYKELPQHNSTVWSMQYSEHRANSEQTQSKLRAHSEHTQWTPKEHSEHTQRAFTCRAYLEGTTFVRRTPFFAVECLQWEEKINFAVSSKGNSFSFQLWMAAN